MSFERRSDSWPFELYIYLIVTLWQNTAINVAKWCSMCKRITFFVASHKNCIWFLARMLSHLTYNMLGTRSFAHSFISLHSYFRKRIADRIWTDSISHNIFFFLFPLCGSVSHAKRITHTQYSLIPEEFFGQSAHHLIGQDKCFGSYNWTFIATYKCFWMNVEHEMLSVAIFKFDLTLNCSVGVFEHKYKILWTSNVLQWHRWNVR